MSALTAILPWQFGQWERLAWQLGEGRLPHALLLVGAPGIGKARFARALAQRMLCSAPEADAACGHCKSCQLNLAGSHPDLVVIEPEKNSRVIKVDQVRELVDWAGKTAQQGGARVVVLDPADALNANAANALLKCLEEPGSSVFFLLVSSRPSSVLPTVRSRCQRVQLPEPQPAHALQWLSGVLGSEERAASLLASGVQPLQALAWSDGQQPAVREHASRALLAVAQRRQNPVAAAAALAESPLEDALYWLLAAVRDGLRHWADPSRAAALEFAPQVLFAAHEAITEALKMARSGSNPNAQLLLEQLLLRWAELTRPERPGRERM